MRTVNVSAISQLISKLCIAANMKLRDDVLKAIKNALRKEKNTNVKKTLQFMLFI